MEPTPQCQFCLDLYTEWAVAEEVQANATQCTICAILAAVTSIYEYETGQETVGVGFVREAALLRGFTVSVFAREGHKNYRVGSSSKEVPKLPYDLPIRQSVSIEPSLAELAAALRQWLNACNSTHSQCHELQKASKGVELPSRVLHVGSKQAPGLKVVDLPSDAKFCALSYCWGTAKQLQLTKAKYDDFQSAIPEDELPQTIRDAVYLARELEIPYLWVDALCIIQDDAKDWDIESSKMKNVYGGAYLVVSADRGANSNAGFLNSRVRRSHSITISTPDGASMGISVHPGATVDDGEKMHNFVLSGYKTESMLIDACPVFARGWCLQEYLLATRIVHFTGAEMVWECAADIHCECQALDAPNRDKSLPWVPEGYAEPRKMQWNRQRFATERLQALASWWDSIEQYSSRKLTKQTDKLVAVAGIASGMPTDILGKYCAGLWEEELPNGLLWGTFRDVFLDPKREAATGAPSWSWASITGYIRRPDNAPRAFNLSAEAQAAIASKEFHFPKSAQVLEIDCIPLTSNIHGQVARAAITLQTSMFAVKLRSVSDSGSWHDYFEICRTDADDKDQTLLLPHFGLHDCRVLDVFSSLESKNLNGYLKDLDIRCVIITDFKMKHGERSFGSLLVIPVQSHEQLGKAFRRIGRVDICIASPWDGLAEMCRVTLV